jgi:hypothetical protein
MAAKIAYWFIKFTGLLVYQLVFTGNSFGGDGRKNDEWLPDLPTGRQAEAIPHMALKAPEE